MTNMVMLVGRIINVEINENDEKSKIKIAVNRTYKNADGIYETDFFECYLFPVMYSKVNEYCQKGDLIGIRGNLRSKDDKIEIVANQITFLNSATNKGVEEESEDNE